VVAKLPQPPRFYAGKDTPIVSARSERRAEKRLAYASDKRLSYASEKRVAEAEPGDISAKLTSWLSSFTSTTPATSRP
jgi:hypothetical protein